MKLRTIEITKRSKSRPVQIPDYERNSWRNNDSLTSAKFYRFLPETTEYRRGQLTIVFDLAGKPIEGWSYYTCMFCYAAPTEDFPNGRLIENDAGYGSTTGGHVSIMRAYFAGVEDLTIAERNYSRVQIKVRTVDLPGYTYDVMRDSKAYTSAIKTRKVSSQWHYRAVQICWGRGATSSDMRHELATHERQSYVKARNAEWAEQRAFNAERMAQAKAERDAEDRAEGLADGTIIDLAAQRAAVGAP